MATKTYKRLGATTVTADNDATLYTVPSSTSTVVSSIVVCNLGNMAQTFRIAMRDGTISNEDYIAYDTIISSNDSIVFSCGFTLPTGMIITVRANSANVIFSAWGSEITV